MSNGFTLYVITQPEANRYRVGKPNRDYLECLRHGQLIVRAMHGGKLPHLRYITVRPGEPDAPEWKSGFLPGDEFDSGPAAVYACAHLAALDGGPNTPSLIPEAVEQVPNWLRCNEQHLVQQGVLEELNEGRMRLRRMPERNDLAVALVAEGEEISGENP